MLWFDLQLIQPKLVYPGSARLEPVNIGLAQPSFDKNQKDKNKIIWEFNINHINIKKISESF